MTEHEYFDELAAGYALHGLSADEELAFVTHLADCDECAASLVDHNLVAAQLGSIAHYRETSDDAPSWESMRASIVTQPQDPPAVTDLAQRRRRYDVSRRTLGAAAAVVVVAGGGIVGWQLASSGSSSCTASHNCHLVQLDAAHGASLASLVIRDNHVTVTPTDMPPAPAGKVYVLWQVPRDAQATPISQFKSGTGGPPATGRLDVAYADTQQFAISLEQKQPQPPVMPSNTLASGLAS